MKSSARLAGGALPRAEEKDSVIRPVDVIVPRRRRTGKSDDGGEFRVWPENWRMNGSDDNIYK